MCFLPTVDVLSPVATNCNITRGRKTGQLRPMITQQQTTPPFTAVELVPLSELSTRPKVGLGSSTMNETSKQMISHRARSGDCCIAMASSESRHNSPVVERQLSE